MTLNAQIVGNVGLYFACYHLSLLGWNVMPTARNARGVDVIAYNVRGTRYIGIQIKTLSKRSPVPLGTSLEHLMGDFWIIINQAVSEPTAFILLPDEIKSLAHRGEKDGKVSYWLQPKNYDCAEYRNAWHRLPDNRDERSDLPKSSVGREFES